LQALLEKPLRAALKRKAYLLVGEVQDALHLIKWKANLKHPTNPNLLRRQHRKKYRETSEESHTQEGRKDKNYQKDGMLE